MRHFSSRLSRELPLLSPTVQIWILLAIPAVMFVRMALNAIDGMLAKEHDMKSDAGAMLNEMSDVLSDAALYLPFALITGVSASWVVLFVIMAILTEMAGYSEHSSAECGGMMDRWGKATVHL
jgi:phosphatidylglycerophosphate synthase